MQSLWSSSSLQHSCHALQNVLGSIPSLQELKLAFHLHRHLKMIRELAETPPNAANSLELFVSQRSHYFLDKFHSSCQAQFDQIQIINISSDQTWLIAVQYALMHRPHHFFSISHSIVSAARLMIKQSVSWLVQQCPTPAGVPKHIFNKMIGGA